MPLQRSGLLLCLIGPAGSGKTTIAKKLLEEFTELSRSVSVTSRAPRAGEQNGVHYHFVSAEEFKKRTAAGAFFEWEETHGNLYGTLRQTLDSAIASSGDMIFDIDIRGACNLKRAYPKNAAIVFLVPPSLQELEQRIKDRGSVSQADLDARMATAKAEYDLLLKDLEGESLVDYIVVNDNLDLSYEQVKSILVSERSAKARISREALKQLLCF